MSYAKYKGSQGEQIALSYLRSLGLKLLAQNYTIANGEVDIIVESATTRIFVEVKSVPKETELADYITPYKLAAYTRAVHQFQRTHPTDKDQQIDVIFVTDNAVLEHYENITFYA